MFKKITQLILMLAVTLSSQIFAEDRSTTQQQLIEKAKHKLNTRAIYPNANISQNSEGKWVYSSKGRGTYQKKYWIFAKNSNDSKLHHYHQDEFKTPDIFYPQASSFTIEEMKGSHIPESNLKTIEGYLQGLVEQCENIYDFDNSFYNERSKDKPFVEVTTICNEDDSSLCLSKLAHRIQRCVPYYRLKFYNFVRLSEKNNPLRVEYTNLEESYLLLKQYEIIYLTLRANHLMGKYGKLMIPMTLLQEYAKETGLYQYIQEQNPPIYEKTFGNERYDDYAEIYFKGREAWQDGFAEFLDRKTTELSILERDYTIDPLDFNQLRDEFKEIYPKRYIPQSRKFNPSWTNTLLQDEMKIFRWSDIHISPVRGPDLEYLGMYDKLRFNNYTYAEKAGTHLSKEQFGEAHSQLIPLLDDCVAETKLKGKQLHYKLPPYPIQYDQVLYPLFLLCIKNVPHYNLVLSNAWPMDEYFLWYQFEINKKLVDSFPILGSVGIQDSVVDRTLLQQGSIIETELYPKIYLIIRHYRLLGRFPNAPIPTKLLDEYLDTHSNNVNRNGYGSIIGYIFDHQDDFAEFLDNKFNELFKEKP